MKPILMHAIPCNSVQFRAIPRIFNCFLFRNYSAIARNEMAQAEATIERNSAQLRLETLILTHSVNLKVLCF